MKFSIIIPVRSVNDFLIENIFHIKELDHKDFEAIILIDEKSNFDFNDGRFKFVYVKGNKGPGEKRNIGVEKSIGEVVVFLDDDAYPAKYWLTEAESIFSDPEVYALGAPAVTPLNANFLEKMGGRVLESVIVSAGTIFRHIPSKSRYIDDYPTVNLFVRRSSFNEIGGFTVEFWPGEDTKLCLDLVNKNNRNFLYDPRPIVYHHRRELFRPHLKQISRYGKHRGQFAKIFPKTSRKLSYFVPSLFVFGLIFGWLIHKTFYISILITYLVLVLFESFRKGKNLKELYYVYVGIILTHLFYGINFIIGFINRPSLELRSFDKKTGKYLGG